MRLGPPNATRVPLFYARGGGMLMGTTLGAGEDSRAALFVDTMRSFPIALDDKGWAKATCPATRPTSSRRGSYPS